jgi:solute carrier family 50 (sugar transporter)
MDQVLTTSGYFIALTLFYSPFPTIRKMINEKDATKYSSLPHFSLMSVCFFWGSYALFYQHRMDLVVLNIIGILVCTYYLSFFFVYSRRKIQVILVSSYIAMILLHVILFYICFFILPNGYLIVGTLAVIVNISLFASTLKAMYLAIKEKNITRLPVFFIWIGLVSCVNWLAFAIVIEDVFVAIPNICGLVLNIAQLVLVRYLKKFSQPKPAINGSLSRASGFLYNSSSALMTASTKTLSTSPSQSFESENVATSSESDNVATSSDDFASTSHKFQYRFSNRNLMLHNPDNDVELQLPKLVGSMDFASMHNQIGKELSSLQ